MTDTSFRIGINMAGAISAGAYTAGVFDFLIEALDAWQLAKDNGEPVPTHNVSIEVLSGASAGGMCAAIAAVTLFDSKPPNGPSKFYSAWVDGIDVTRLLHQSDLKGSTKLKSLLNSQAIGKIAEEMLRVQKPACRDYVSKNLNLFLTLTDVRGLPYGVNFSNDNSFEEHTNYYADQIQFQVTDDTVSKGGAVSLPLHEPDNPAWQTLRVAAQATGAVPVMLAPQIIARCAKDYTGRMWHVSNATPCKDPRDGSAPSSGNGNCWCEQDTTIEPAWEKPPTAPLQQVYIDGGATNNNPFECARLFLARQNGVTHNLRPPELANAAVVTISPFPGADTFDPAWNKDGDQANLGTVLHSLKDILVNQSRFTGESLSLLKDLNVASRYMISPDDSDDAAPAVSPGGKKTPALQCGCLAAFGGFLSRDFRDHDYQLGRRNCQKFLKQWFVLPVSNPIIAAGLKENSSGLIAAFQADRVAQRASQAWMPIIPLVGMLNNPIPNPERKVMPVKQLDQALAAVAARLAAILRICAPKGPWGFLLSFFAGVLARRVVAKARPLIVTDLQRAKCLSKTAR